jgi:hypothetical protein
LLNQVFLNYFVDQSTFYGESTNLFGNSAGY